MDVESAAERQNEVISDLAPLTLPTGSGNAKHQCGDGRKDSVNTIGMAEALHFQARHQAESGH